MPTVISETLEDILRICHRYNMREMDIAAIETMYKQIAFEWCSTAATACYLDDFIRESCADSITYQKFLRKFCSEYDAYQDAKLRETYPWHEEG